MFEIGRELQDARDRRGLSLAQVEADTKIRARYIRALEAEAWDVLPGRTYTRGFLRAYADYLGLDGQIFIDEYNSLQVHPRSGDEPIYPSPRSRPRPRQRRESGLAMIVLAAIVAISALVFLAFSFSGPETPDIVRTDVPPSQADRADGGDGGRNVAGGGTTAPTREREQAPKRRHTGPFPVALTASGGGCWVQITRGSREGEAVTSTAGDSLFNHIIQPGETVRFRSARPVYALLGAPGSLTVRIDGRAAPLPAQTTDGSWVRITRAGITPA